MALRALALLARALRCQLGEAGIAASVPKHWGPGYMLRLGSTRSRVPS